MNRSNPVWLIAIGLIAPLCVVLGAPVWLRLPITLYFVLTAPGAAIVGWLALKLFERIALTVVVSFLLETALAMVMIYTGTWSISLSTQILGTICVLSGIGQAVWNRWRLGADRHQVPGFENHLLPPTGLRGSAPERMPVLALRTLLANASSMMGSIIVNTGLGFVYWWFAARTFDHAAVGLASAMISVMMLLSSVGVMGLGSLLMGELKRQSRNAGALIATSLAIAGGCGLMLALLFAAIAPRLLSAFAPIASSWSSVALFASAVALACISLVFDDAMIGMLQARLQLWRNTLLAILKLVSLAGVVMFGVRSGMALLLTWNIAMAVSLLIMIWTASRTERFTYQFRPKPLWELRQQALRHHGLNIVWQSVGNLLPLIVTATVSLDANASFYIAYMIASLGSFGPHALVSVLYAMTSAEPETLALKLRNTLKWSALFCVAFCVGGLVSAHTLLSVFGTRYASDAEIALRILVLTVIPSAIKVHFIAITRVQKALGRGVRYALITSVVELTAAILGARMGGLPGLCIGYLIGQSLSALGALKPVLDAANLKRNAVADNPDLQTETGAIEATEDDRVRYADRSVCAVVLTFNRRDLVRKCLKAIQAQSRKPNCILVIDNASTDGTASMIEREFPEVEVIRIRANVGSAGGFSQCLQQAHRRHFGWAWIMDDDCIPENGALAAYLDALVRFPHTKQPSVLAGDVLRLDGSRLLVHKPAFGFAFRQRALWRRRVGLPRIRAATFVSTMIRLVDDHSDYWLFSSFGYNRSSLTRASPVRNRQSTLAFRSFRSVTHASATT